MIQAFVGKNKREREQETETAGQQRYDDGAGVQDQTGFKAAKEERSERQDRPEKEIWVLFSLGFNR